jgi:hypothetical protein
LVIGGQRRVVAVGKLGFDLVSVHRPIMIIPWGSGFRRGFFGDPGGFLS